MENKIKETRNKIVALIFQSTDNLDVQHDLLTLIDKYADLSKHEPSELVEIIYLEEGIDSMDYAQYDKDGEIIKCGNIQYPQALK